MTNSATAQSTPQGTGKLPDGTTIPSQAIKAPASISNPGEIAPDIAAGSERKAGSSAHGIPAAALSAYQRAAQVLDAADKGCHIEWTLIAAIGRVESNHGRYGGNTLDGNGVTRPGIYGIPLTGSNGTSRVSDTDAGQYDHDKTIDRAVGPMQFIPSTWSVIGVDGDGDGQRNPQDIDDAALATAVYLCSGHEDLSSTSGQRSAVLRYNHSNDYVNLVLSIARAYASGDFTSVPTSTGGGTTFTPSYGDSVIASGASGYQYPKGRGYGTNFDTTGGGFGGSKGSGGSGGSRGSSSGSGGSGSPGGGSGGGSGGSSSGSSTSGGSPSGSTAPSSAPSVPTTTGGGGGSGSDPTTTVKKTATKVTAPVTKKLPKPPSTPAPPKPVTDTLAKAQATQKCLDSGISKLDVAALNACIVTYTG